MQSVAAEGASKCGESVVVAAKLVFVAHSSGSSSSSCGLICCGIRSRIRSNDQFSQIKTTQWAVKEEETQIESEKVRATSAKKITICRCFHSFNYFPFSVFPFVCCLLHLRSFVCVGTYLYVYVCVCVSSRKAKCKKRNVQCSKIIDGARLFPFLYYVNLDCGTWVSLYACV